MPSEPRKRDPAECWQLLRARLEEELGYNHWHRIGYEHGMLTMIRGWMDKIERGEWPGPRMTNGKNER